MKNTTVKNPRMLREPIPVAVFPVRKAISKVYIAVTSTETGDAIYSAIGPEGEVLTVETLIRLRCRQSRPQAVTSTSRSWNG